MSLSLLFERCATRLFFVQIGSTRQPSVTLLLEQALVKEVSSGIDWVTRPIKPNDVASNEACTSGQASPAPGLKISRAASLNTPCS